eukprot:g4662.t1
MPSMSKRKYKLEILFALINVVFLSLILVSNDCVSLKESIQKLKILPFPSYNIQLNKRRASSSIDIDSDKEINGIKLSLKILACDRPHSLQRLLASIDTAAYPPVAIIDIDFLIDVPAFFIDVAHERAHQQTITIATVFQWNRGQKRIHIRKLHAGLLQQWLEAWDPRKNVVCADGDKCLEEKGLILEDDLELSPFYYQWLCQSISIYGGHGAIAGISLQRQLLVATNGRLDLPIQLARSSSSSSWPYYMYKLPGSWGFAPSSVHWAAFLDWYETRSKREVSFSPVHDCKVSVENLVTSKWYITFVESGLSDTMWTAWFICFCAERNLFTLYLNSLTSEKALVRHWSDSPSLHHYPVVVPNVEEKKLGENISSYDSELFDMPISLSKPSKLLAFDWNLSPLRKISENYHSNKQSLFSDDDLAFARALYITNKSRILILASVNFSALNLAENWLHFLDNLGIDHYVLLAHDDESYEYFKNKGRNVIHFFGKASKESDFSYGDLLYQKFVHDRSKAVLQLIRNGISVLIADIDAVWLKNPIPFISLENDIVASIDGHLEGLPFLCGGFLFLRSNEKVINVWTRVIHLHGNKLNFSKNINKSRKVSFTEQKILNDIIHKEEIGEILSIQHLPENLFPSGDKIDWSTTFKPGNTVVLHANYMTGILTKEESLKKVGLFPVDKLLS